MSMLVSRALSKALSACEHERVGDGKDTVVGGNIMQLIRGFREIYRGPRSA